MKVMIASLLLAAAAAAVPAMAAAQDPATRAKLSMAQARQIALNAYPGGKIMKEELERERGGLRYSFDIKRGRTWREVGVDAMSGKILENKAESAYPKD